VADIVSDIVSDMAAGPERRDPREEVQRLRYEIQELIATGRALASERDTRTLLSLILKRCREMTGADAGSVYVLEGEGAPAEKSLHFMLSQNDSLQIDFQEFSLGVDAKSIVGKAVLDARPINIADLDALDQPGQNPWGVQHNRTFDQKTGYTARSMLTVPMLSAHAEVIGVIQLINRKRSPDRLLRSPRDFEREVVPFDQRAEEFALSLAAQAGISLENAILYEEIRELFEGFVDASVTAIESRDPTTSGHSRRVATLTVALATKVDGISEGPLAGVRFTRDDLRQIQYAGMLHDFGKVGVRERVLVKPRKLYDEELRDIQARFAYIRKTLEVEALQRKLKLCEEQGAREAAQRYPALDAELARRQSELEGMLALVVKANEPTVMEQGGFERLLEIAQQRYPVPGGESRPFLEPAELAALQVRRGSLTDLERVEIESHVVHTYNFLNKIPWGRTLRNIPRIAGAHHEYLNGHGYPRRLDQAQIPIESRMMTIADIFDALTASDRPYKKAVPVDRALGIVEAEVKAGKLDATLFELFVGSQIYKAVL